MVAESRASDRLDTSNLLSPVKPSFAFEPGVFALRPLQGTSIMISQSRWESWRYSARQHAKNRKFITPGPRPNCTSHGIHQHA
jgi:hypothetical protein